MFLKLWRPSWILGSSVTNTCVREKRLTLMFLRIEFSTRLKNNFEFLKNYGGHLGCSSVANTGFREKRLILMFLRIEFSTRFKKN